MWNLRFLQQWLWGILLYVTWFSLVEFFWPLEEYVFLFRTETYSKGGGCWFSETLISFYKTTKYHIPEDSILENCGRTLYIYTIKFFKVSAFVFIKSSLTSNPPSLLHIRPKDLTVILVIILQIHLNKLSSCVALQFSSMWSGSTCFRDSNYPSDILPVFV